MMLVIDRNMSSILNNAEFMAPVSNDVRWEHERLVNRGLKPE